MFMFMVSTGTMYTMHQTVQIICHYIIPPNHSIDVKQPTNLESNIAVGWQATLTLKKNKNSEKRG